MKLAILIHGGVDRGGTHRVIPAVLWLIERLARRHDVHVYAHNQEVDAGEWDLLGARVHNVGSTPGWRRRLFTSFAAEHRRSRFDAIHGFFGWGGTYGAALGWRHRVPVLFHLAGGELVALDEFDYGMRRSLRGRLELRVALAGATRVSVASGYMQRMATTYGARAALVPLGVALDQWPALPPRPRDRSQPARLLHVGDIRPVKDQTTLLGAARALHDAGENFELDMVGLDTMHGAMRRSPDAVAIAERTRWHGTIGRAALRELMEKADVLLMSSRHEAGPLVMLEAAVAGVPTVGTAVGHLEDWAPDAAIAVPVGSVQALTLAVQSMLRSDDHRLAIAAEAQRRALAIDADMTASTFERVYHDMTVPGSR